MTCFSFHYPWFWEEACISEGMRGSIGWSQSDWAWRCLWSPLAPIRCTWVGNELLHYLSLRGDMPLMNEGGLEKGELLRAEFRTRYDQPLDPLRTSALGRKLWLVWPSTWFGRGIIRQTGKVPNFVGIFPSLFWCLSPSWYQFYMQPATWGSIFSHSYSP